jgi:hypothetical protein
LAHRVWKSLRKFIIHIISSYTVFHHTQYFIIHKSNCKSSSRRCLPTRISARSNVTGGLLPLVVWQGVAMNSLKVYLGPQYLTLLRPAGGLPLKWPYGRIRGGSPTGRAACDRLLYPFGHPTLYAYALALCHKTDNAPDALDDPRSGAKTALEG